MFGKFTSALLGLCAGVMIAFGAQAAPVTFSVNNTNLVYTAECTVPVCNATLSGLSIPGSFTLDTGETTGPLQAFSYVALQNATNPRGESNETLNIRATIILDVAGTLYTYIADGLVSGWGINASVGNPNITGSPTLSWTSFILPENSPLAVIFDTALNVVQGTGDEVRSTVRIGLATSVVPLPGGVLLLLTGLLALVGLSRRRRATA